MTSVDLWTLVSLFPGGNCIARIYSQYLAEFLGQTRYLCYFSIAMVTNSHKFSSLKPHVLSHSSIGPWSKNTMTHLEASA